MKRCPKCSREYDASMSFCLDDGAELLYGPASVTDSEPKTAILSGDRVSSEQATRTFDVDPVAAGSAVVPTARIASTRNSVIAGVVGVVLVTALGLGSYLYYGRGSGKQIDSIAVMPFVNESGNADIDYLSDGMTETLINTLTQLPNFTVKPRTSTFRYKGRESEAKTIGRELNVSAILNGRLVQRGDEITLFLSLIDTVTENQIWGKQYTRKLANLVTLQTEIVRDVSANLRSKMSGEEEKSVKSDTENPEAYRLYLQGRFFWNKRRIEGMGRAIGFFQQAIELDPDYARAYAGLADAVAQPNDIVPHLERAGKARAAALKALSLDNNLAEAHTALAHVLLRYDLDFAGTERELDMAVALDPKWPETYQRYGELYVSLGRHDEALSKFRQGLEIEPFNIPLNAACGAGLIYARRYDEAIDQLKKAIGMETDHRNAHIALVMAYSLKGMYPEAVEHRIIALRIADQHEWAESVREGFAKEGWTGVLKAELVRFGARGYSADRLPHYNKAHLLAALGEKDQAFAELENSLEKREQPALVFLKTDPRFDPLRDDPRFKELLRRVGFPE